MELQGFPCTSRSTVDIRVSRCSSFHEVPPSPPCFTPTLISWIKVMTPFECKCQIILATFDFCWCRRKFSYGGWCCYALESSSCTNKRGRTWRSTAWCECLSTVAWRRTIQKSGAHLSQSFYLEFVLKSI